LKPTLTSLTLAGSTFDWPRIAFDGLALQLGRIGDRVLADRDDRGQRLLDERPDGDELAPLLAGQQQLRLIGDRQVDLAGRQELQRGRRVRRRLDLDVEAGAPELAGALGRVDPRMVGVGEVVEHQPHGLHRGRGGGGLLLRAAGGEGRHGGEGEQDGGQAAGHGCDGPSDR
jgi:hypothetical protein